MYQHQAPRGLNVPHIPSRLKLEPWEPRSNVVGESIPRMEQTVRQATKFSKYRSGASHNLYFGPT